MKNKYSFCSNLKYFFKIMVSIDKVYVLILFLLPIISLSVSIVEVFLPKMVLDGISQNKSIPLLISEIAMLVVFIAILKFLQVKYKKMIEIKSWKFYFLYGQRQVEKKKMTVSYTVFASPYGKQISEKAFYSVCGNPESSFVSLFSHLKDSVVNIITIVCFGVILSTLNPLIIVFLLLSYIIDGIVALIIEKFKKKLRENDAEIWRKKRYISQYTTLADFAKDIRIFNLKDLINTKRKLLLKEEIKNTDNKEKFTIVQLLIEAFLVLLRDGLAYSYLVYKAVNYSMSIGDFMLYFTIISCFGMYLQNLVNSIQGTSQANNNLKFFREFIDCEEEKTDGKSVASLKNHTIRMEH